MWSSGAKLRDAGLRRIMLIDKAGGIGGTWYWNRYPGVMCDVESYIYMPMLEEMNYVPTTRYAFGDEIRRHLDAIATKYGLVDDALFHTGVETSQWDESSTALGDQHRSRRRGPRPLPHPGARDPQPHEAAGDPGHGRLPGHGVPHRPVGLRVHRRRARTTRTSPSSPTRSSASSVWARAGSRRCRRWRSRRSTCTCSSARRRRSGCAATGPPTSSSASTCGPVGRGSGWRTSAPS